MSMMIKVEEQSVALLSQGHWMAEFRTPSSLIAAMQKMSKNVFAFVRPETPEAGGSHGAGGRRVFSGPALWIGLRR